jgi:hypothetical protein
MRVTIIREDGVVGIDGHFKKVNMDYLSTGIRAVQWDSSSGSGHIEYDDMSNAELTSIADFQTFIDSWNAPDPLPVIPAPSADEMKASALSRINAAYQSSVDALTAGYPAGEIASWPKQEAEARAWLSHNSVSTPWMDAAVAARGITKDDLAAKIIGNADLFTASSGQLSGKRQKLRDQILALGDSVTQAQLDAIQW